MIDVYNPSDHNLTLSTDSVHLLLRWNHLFQEFLNQSNEYNITL